MALRKRLAIQSSSSSWTIILIGKKPKKERKPRWGKTILKKNWGGVKR
jgi:hypothetical protein